MPTYDRYPPRYPFSAYLWPLVLLAFLVLFLWWRFAPPLPFWPSWRANPASNSADAQPRDPTPRGDLMEIEKTTINLYKRVAPSVVHITSLAAQRDYFSMNVQQVPKGTGSGFIWSKEGHVVTNYHVIEGAAGAEVVLADHSSWKAGLVGAYPDKDVAVLKISAPADRLHPIEVGTSHDLQVGQSVFAIGNPFGLDQTLTTGIISALNREIESVTERPIRGVIQTDAAINPGNSGGPLLDSSGRLIGVNTAIYSPSGSSAGIGFAIPVDEVNSVAAQLIAQGKVSRPDLGVNVATDQMAQEIGVKGALVLTVLSDGPAARAGIQPTRRDRNRRLVLGDVIVGIDGKPIQSRKDLFTTLEGYKVGDTIKVQLVRNGEKLEVPVTLDAVS
jgi:S1-C subfamily serine protease